MLNRAFSKNLQQLDRQQLDHQQLDRQHLDRQQCEVIIGLTSVDGF